MYLYLKPELFWKTAMSSVFIFLSLCLSGNLAFWKHFTISLCTGCSILNSMLVGITVFFNPLCKSIFCQTGSKLDLQLVSKTATGNISKGNNKITDGYQTKLYFGQWRYITNVILSMQFDCSKVKDYPFRKKFI